MVNGNIIYFHVHAHIVIFSFVKGINIIIEFEIIVVMNILNQWTKCSILEGT